MVPMSVQFSNPFSAVHYLSTVSATQWLVWGLESDLICIIDVFSHPLFRSTYMKLRCELRSLFTTFWNFFFSSLPSPSFPIISQMPSFHVYWTAIEGFVFPTLPHASHDISILQPRSKKIRRAGGGGSVECFPCSVFLPERNSLLRHYCPSLPPESWNSLAAGEERTRNQGFLPLSLILGPPFPLEWGIKSSHRTLLHGFSAKFQVLVSIVIEDRRYWGKLTIDAAVLLVYTFLPQPICYNLFFKLFR